MSIIIFLVILALLVLVHEFGHFITAKLSGIRVDEFGLGFPPRAVGIKKGGTIYSLNWIPFGGFVRIFGETPDEASIDGPDKEKSFFNKPKSIQALVLVAGIVFNILFAWLLISIGFMIGMPAPEGYSASMPVTNPKVTVIDVTKNTPASEAGLIQGDVIIHLQAAASSENVQKVTDVQDFVAAHSNQSVTLTYIRGGQQKNAAVTPELGEVPGRATIGVTLEDLGILKLNFFQSVWEGMKLTAYLVQETVVSISLFIYQAVTGRASLSEVTGPVGIAGAVGSAASLGFVYLLSFTALISINLAVINLIPFPALDGGRLLMTLIEKIKGSPINRQYANIVNFVGFIILIGFMLVVTYHDILNLIHH